MTGPISDESVLRRLLQHMNSQAPSRRLTLSELLKMSDPHYVGRDGNEYVISVEELKSIRNRLDALGISDIKLPIVLMADSSLEQSSWRVEGESECALVLHILGRDSSNDKARTFLYAPHVAALRRLLPTATVCLMMP